MRKLMKRCRKCEGYYSRIKGLVHFDNLCCSERCYVSIGPVKAKVVDPTPAEVFHHSKNWQPKAKSKKRNKPWGRQREVWKDKFTLSMAWRKLRYLVLNTYGRVCMCCGRTKGEMHVDHIKPRSTHPSLALAFSNLQVLCADCNIGKGTSDHVDYRPVDAKEKFKDLIPSEENKPLLESEEPVCLP